MVLRLAAFIFTALAAFVVLSASFGLVCVGLGHDTLEMMYGGTAVYLLTLAAAVEGAWLLPDEIRGSSLFTRLTQRFGSSPD